MTVTPVPDHWIGRVIVNVPWAESAALGPRLAAVVIAGVRSHCHRRWGHSSRAQLKLPAIVGHLLSDVLRRGEGSLVPDWMDLFCGTVRVPVLVLMLHTTLAHTQL